MRLAQNWQQFTIRLILKVHEVGSSFYSKEGPKLAKQMEGNLKPKCLNLGS